MLANGGWDLIQRLTLILLTWTIWRAPTNASKWRMRFNSAFKGLMKLEFFWTDSRKKKNSSIKFREKSVHNRIVPYAQTDRQTDMIKLTDAFHNFAEAPKKKSDA